jgi:ribosome-binding factor A
VSHVDVSADLRRARVFVSRLGDEAQVQGMMHALERASSLIRRQVGRRVKLRYLPQLQFRLDEGFARSQRLLSLLEEVEPGAGESTAEIGGDAPKQRPEQTEKEEAQ